MKKKLSSGQKKKLLKQAIRGILVVVEEQDKTVKYRVQTPILEDAVEYVRSTHKGDIKKIHAVRG